MRYEGTVYRPPSEADSLLIQATIGCPHNRCTFCPMYKGVKFRVKRVEEIKQDLDTAFRYMGDSVPSLFFPDGNTIIMKPSDLEEILKHARALFPSMGRITMYGSAKFIVRKSLDDLKRIKEAGLSRVHMGIETGDPDILLEIRKGVTPDQMIKAGRLLMDAGLETSVYIMVGIGGKTNWQKHAENSANVINAINPSFIRLRTTVPVPGTPLFSKYSEGSFQLQSPHEAIKETRLFVELLDVSSYIASDHISNYCNVEGQLPGDKSRILDYVNQMLELDSSHFRRSLIGHQL